MKKIQEILEKTRTLISSENFKTAHRLTDRDFIRNCLVTFPILVISILNLMRKSLQAELNDLVKITGLPVISKQVFSAARKKLLSTAFIELNNHLVQEFYCDNEYKKFSGYRLIAIDGSTLQLPESYSIRKKYGSCSNQKDGMTMSRISYAYDPLNGMTFNAIMKPYASSEQTIVYDLITKIPPSNCAKDLCLFDRGYPSIALVFFLLFHGKDFVMRCSTAWLTLVNQILKSGKRDELIEISPSMLVGQKRTDFQKKLPSVSLKLSVKIRVLIIDLPTGEKEILITSLLDRIAFKYGMFKELYHQRWGAEENYKFHKVRIEIENFSGKTVHSIEQDFHATVFTSNVRALLAKEAEEEARSFRKKQCKYDYKINKNISISILKDEIVEALLDPTIDLKAFCDRLKGMMRKSIVPIRPGRKYERIRKSYRKYPMNRRRAL